MTRLNPVSGLLTLPRSLDESDRRTKWRQAISALGRSVRVVGPSRLDGFDPADLLTALRLALATGLADDLSWLSPESAAIALYELSLAVPPGPERRELGRRVFARLYEGNAATFAAVATRMALSSSRALDAPTMRARIALVFDMPLGATVNADALAYALCSRAELRDRWLDRASTGSLPNRRLAARLLERAATEAANRQLEGDHLPREVLGTREVAVTFERLLADREPLVWRHAAVARGVLATVDDRVADLVAQELDPSLSPTEWRRAAVSLVASAVSDPEAGLRQVRGLLEGPIVERDPGLIATLVWGLGPLIEAEPEGAEAILELIADTRRVDVAENVALLLAETTQSRFGEHAAHKLKSVLAGRLAHEDLALSALAMSSLRLLTRGDSGTLRDQVLRALRAYEETGARPAYELALAAVAAAHGSMDRLEELDPFAEANLTDCVALVEALDGAVLERSRLADLLLLGRRLGETDALVPEMDRLHDRLGSWVLRAEARRSESEASFGVLLARQRRLRALLHLVDLETTQADSDDGSAQRVRARVRRLVRALLSELEDGPDGAVHRILCAALARGFDAAVREGVADPSDLLLIVAQLVSERESLHAIAEGSTHPELSVALGAWCDFASDPSELDDDEAPGSMLDPARLASNRALRLARRLGFGGAYRGEALRQVVLRLGRALESIAAARGLVELVDTSQSGDDPIGELELSAEQLRQLLTEARRRVLEEALPTEIAVIADVPTLSALVDRAVTGVPFNEHQLDMALRELVADLPPSFAALITRAAARVQLLPVAPPSDVFAIPLEKRRAELPDWLLPRRTIGAFYVVRALGSGGVSSVFVTKRLEERHDRKAESFALKVPQFDPTTARSLSEQEFLQMFRDEAGALLSLPQHPNLARFVTFDLAARPKPILVMELIHGVSLERVIRSETLTVKRALAFMDGILAGLEAMHAVGVGHLDVKPSNVIIRNDDTPVLVDFGLSGRKLRPGCGTPEYSSPEVLGVVPEGYAPPPRGADMYAFACTSFELLTGELLFDASEEIALLSSHVTHDGWPPRLTSFAENSAVADLAVVMAACLRRDPRSRPTATETRQALRNVWARLEGARWPLPVFRQAAASG